MVRWLMLACLLAGCFKRSFDPTQGPEPPSSAHPAALKRFEQGRAMFERDEYNAAAKELETVLRDFPGDPIAKHATLFAGLAMLREGRYESATRTLRPLSQDAAAEEDLRTWARFFLGLAEAYQEHWPDARVLLAPFDGKITVPEERGELNAALAQAAAAAGDDEAALRQFDAWWKDARPAERAYIVARVRTIVAALPDQTVRRAWERSEGDGIARAILSMRVYAHLRSAGDAAGAAEAFAQGASARAAAGIEEELAIPGAVDPDLLGAVVPLTGRGRLVGEAFVRGLALASGTFENVGSPVANDEPRPFRLAVEDGASAAAAVDRLAGLGVVAILGPADKQAIDQAARRVETTGVPLVTLDVAGAPVEPGPTQVFRIAPSPEARSRALASAAVARGARSFAILSPKLNYGTRAAKAFRVEVERLGGSISVTASYEKDATSFVEPVKQIASKSFDALFIPDTAARLELIAPQLAVANLVVGPFGARRPQRRRAITLLSLAEALSPRFISGSGRYTHGALFAPGFFPDEADPRIGPFVAKYRAVFGTDPGYLDAYAYDAARLVRSAVQAGARTREALGLALAQTSVPGLTGDIGFGPNRERADSGVLFTVVRSAPDIYEIHAVR